MATTVSFGPSSTNKFITTYFRRAITVTDPSAISSLALRLRRDDGAVLYLNGTEILRSNMPTGTIAFNTLASSTVQNGDEDAFFSFTVPSTGLVAGNNVLAVEIHQRSASSSDIVFDLEVIGNPNTPPTITAITNRTINQGTSTGAITFTIGDTQTPVANLTVTANSSNTALVPNAPANITLAGTTASRTVTVTPLAGLTGSTTITLIVTDLNGATVNTSFVVTVI
jgi:hypothetical protein